jgi:hypothetical protein
MRYALLVAQDIGERACSGGHSTNCCASTGTLRRNIVAVSANVFQTMLIRLARSMVDWHGCVASLMSLVLPMLAIGHAMWPWVHG